MTDTTIAVAAFVLVIDILYELLLVYITIHLKMAVIVISTSG
jgi:hypothetical protein